MFNSNKFLEQRELNNNERINKYIERESKYNKTIDFNNSNIFKSTENKNSLISYNTNNTNNTSKKNIKQLNSNNTDTAEYIKLNSEDKSRKFWKLNNDQRQVKSKIDINIFDKEYRSKAILKDSHYISQLNKTNQSTIESMNFTKFKNMTEK